MDASNQLLAMLNMGPAASSSGPPSQSQSQSQPSPSLLGGAQSPSTYATPLPSSANSQYQGASSNPPSDLERIFGKDFAGLRRAADSSPSETASQVGTGTDGVRRVARGSSNGLYSRGSDSAPQPQPPTSSSAADQSTSLLHLLHQLAPPHPDHVALPSAAALPPAPATLTAADDLLARLMMPGAFTPSPPQPPKPPAAGAAIPASVAAAQARPPTPYSAALPASVQASLSGSSHRSSPLGPRGERASPTPAAPSSAEPTTPAPAPAPTTPQFAFNSPFDVLAQSTEGTSPKVSPRKVSAPAKPSLKSSTAPPSIASVIAAPVTPPPASPHASSLNSTADSAIDRSLLAVAHLAPEGEFDQPEWAPVGIEVNQDTVKVDVTKASAEGIDPRQVEVTPITLFAVPARWERGVRVGAWDRGLCYGTKHGKVRVIDRVYGSKLLLKGQAVAVVDLAIAPAAETTTNAESGEGQVRAVASVGHGNRLVVWKAPEEFASNDPGYERTLEILGDASGEGPRFRLLRFHPLYPAVPVLAVALNDGSVVFLDLANQALLNPVPRDESIFATVGKVAHTGAPIVDLTFSPDGTAFAILSADHTYTIRHTHEPFELVLSATLPLAAGAPLSCITFLAAPSARPTALAVSSALGTIVHIIPLGPDAAPASAAPAIEFSYAVEPAASFGHMVYHAPSSTLFVSNSLRGSLFALRIAFPPASPTALACDDDVGLLVLPASSEPKRAPHITHLTEIPTPEPLISFILDDFSADPKRLSAVCAHPGGVHSVQFRHKRVEAPGSRWGSPDESRRMSLEGSIYVSSEVVVAVDVPVPGDALLTRSRSMSIKREPTVDDIDEEDSEPTPAPAVATLQVPESPKSSTSAPVKLSGPIVNAAIKSMKGKAARTPSASSADELRGTIKQETPSSTLVPAPADSVANAWATGHAGAVGNGKKGKDADVVRELRKLEENLPVRISKLVQKEMDKQAQRYDEDRVTDQAADTTRQETMLKLVSTTLTKNTSKLVETTIKEQIKSQVIPAISKLVEAAVAEQVGRGIADALAHTLPNELEALLYRPEMVTHLARNFSTTVAPHLERNIGAVLASSIVPTVASSVSKAVDGVMLAVRQEMVDVRKEIVREQSGALESTESEVHALRSDVRDLKAALARMEKLVGQLVLSPAGPVISARASPRETVEPEPRYTLPAIPRPTTPKADYEDMFTNALQPEHEPEFTSLLYLVNYAPPHRVDALFPARKQDSCITPAVILSLAFRLGQVFGSKTGKLDEDGRRQLGWLRKAINAMDDKDELTADYTPRIIESVIACLTQRRKALVREQDARGAEAVRELLVFAQSRLSVFLAPSRRELYQ